MNPRRPRPPRAPTTPTPTPRPARPGPGGAAARPAPLREELLVPVVALDDEGRGVGTAAGLEVHVTGGLPGELVRARLAHRSPHLPRAWATLVAVEGAPSPERVVPACPGHGRCGGCALQHLAYPAQLTEKRRRVERALAAYPRLAGAPLGDVWGSPHELGYRNKAKYVLAPDPRGGGRVLRGSFEPASHRVVDMAGCRIPEPPIDDVAGAACELLGGLGVPPYDERRRAGELRHLIVRRNHEGRILVVLVTRSAHPRPALVVWARRLRELRPEVAGVVHNVNATTGGAILGPEDHLLDGTGALADRVGELALELSARAFFQVNREGAARLYAEVARACGARPGLRAVDLYCGVGGIALALARRGARVVGIEAHEPAVADARRAARAARLEGRARFEAADAGAGLARAAAWLGGAVDAVVVDPPRRGLIPATRAALVGLAPPRIVYVSCEPATLAADLDALAAAGYRVASVQPIDLMPGTPHVEAFATLTRRG